MLIKKNVLAQHIYGLNCGSKTFVIIFSSVACVESPAFVQSCPLSARFHLFCGRALQNQFVLNSKTNDFVDVSRPLTKRRIEIKE